MVGRTTVVVAHRLSTVRNADVIAVIQEGKIVETGSHLELISKQNSAYSSLIQLEAATSYPSIGVNMGCAPKYFHFSHFRNVLTISEELCHLL